MARFHRKHYKWLRLFPRKKHLLGGRLHRVVGEQLFASDLWKPNRRGIAGGLALGLLVGLTPTMGVQVFIAGICAYALKVNVPVALAGTFITNPLTAAFIYPLEYRLGLQLIGAPDLSELEGYTGMFRAFVRYAKPVWAVALVIGGLTSRGYRLWSRQNRAAPKLLLFLARGGTETELTIFTAVIRLTLSTT